MPLSKHLPPEAVRLLSKLPKVTVSGSPLGIALRLALAALVVTAATPALRRRALELAQPYTHRALTPVHRVVARDRMNLIALALKVEAHRARREVTGADMRRLLPAVFRGHEEDSRDPWGSAFHFRPASGGFRLVSAGPDRRIGTRDDVVTRAHDYALSERVQADFRDD